ncbi:cadherin repeat domain-containing protein [Vibrio diazotrophicus]|uniref:cadherin repeat domain-containing protein n=1 Tax=Vibrio diazotrophicus TaxID=685 RepID=UPI00142DE7DA|nr:cadherin repeat domain-containing protein [Vibrio diazotrophicus]NIY93823.1 cadherin repeat domain-containing protein [Vibrio diazotrophicus]
MNARTLSQFMLANITLVIDRQGQIRELTAGAAPAPGEVVVTVGDGANPQVTAQEVLGDDGQTPLNLDFDAEIANIIAQLEDGVDPTLNPDQATAAGGTSGSALGTSGTVIMQLASLIAATAFSTEGFARDGAGETESLNIDFQAFAAEPVVLAADEPIIPLDENSPPVFIGTEYTTDNDDEDGNEFIPASESDQAMYSFYYDENTPSETVIGQVLAADSDAGDNLVYAFVGEGYDFLEIDPDTGVIKLVYDPDGDWKPNYEDMDNDFVIQVSVSDGNNDPVIADVKLFERNVNEAPQAENFTITVNGDEESIPIIFDTTFGADDDYISDEDVDYLAANPIDINDENYDEFQDVITSQELFVVVTSLPDSGTLWYTDGENDPIEITQSDIDNSTQFIANNITFVPGDGILTIDEQNGEDLLSGTHQGNPAEVVYVDVNGQQYFGEGYGVTKSEEGEGAGGGINKPENLIVDLSDNQLSSVEFTLQGLNPNHGVFVTYTLSVDGNDVTVPTTYYADSDGVTYDEATNTFVVNYEPSEGTITGIDFTTTPNGSSYVVNSISGEEVPADDSFTYYVVDSDGLESGGKTVTLDYVDQEVDSDDSGVVSATLGNETLVGDEQDNVFTWLDNVLDNSTDTVTHFDIGNDRLEIGSILTEDSTSDDIEALLDSGKVQVGNDGDSVTLSVESNDGETQVIVIEDIDVSSYDTLSGFDATAFLNDVLKTNEPI